MAAGAVAHLPASTRAIRLGTGDVITVDVLCRSCGYELRPPWSGRCPECGSGLDAWNTVSFVRDWRGDGSHILFQASDEG